MNQMQLFPSRFLCYMLILTAGLLVFSNLDVLWSQSVDLAHHYALAYRISEQFHLMSSNDPTLGEMNYYPRLSHIFAAAIGVPLNSTLLGIQIISLLSLTGIWGGFVYIINTLPRRIALLSTIALALLMTANKLTLKLEVHGAEINSNFFYSQLVAQAIIILSIASAIFIESRKGRVATYSFLIVVISLNTSVHALPTLELLGMLCALVLFNSFWDLREGKRKAAIIITSLTFPVIGLCGMILNPSFSAMRKIAENNGALNLGAIPYPIGIFALCVVSGVFSAVLLFIYTNKKQIPAYAAIKYIALYGLAASGLCLLQMGLAYLSVGSDYAVKKYSFGIISYLFVASAILIGLVIHRLLPRTLDLSHNTTSVQALLTALCFYIIFKTSVTPHENYDVSELVGLERTLIAAKFSQIPITIDGKSNVIIGLYGLPTTFNYMFSIALAKTPRELAIPDVLRANSLHDYSQYDNVISSSGSKIYDVPACEIHSGGGISINSAACLEKNMQQLSDCQNTFDFSMNGFINQRNLKNFSTQEAEGTWMLGNSSEFSCEITTPPPKNITINLFPFTSLKHRSQKLKILVNDKQLYDQTLSSSETIKIALPTTLGEKVAISFITPDATSPKDEGLSEDQRNLSFYVKSIKFD